jgi:hypothetical protein
MVISNLSGSYEGANRQLRHAIRDFEQETSWKYSEEGYIEKGPFPKSRTRALVAERDYKEASGTATLDILAKDAGPHGRIHFVCEPRVSAESPTVPDAIFETDATVLCDSIVVSCRGPRWAA